MAKNNFKENNGFSVEFTTEDLEKDPTMYEEFASAGENRGVLFEFEDNEVFTFVEPSRFYGKYVKINGKTYPQVFTKIKSNVQGEVPMPISILRRIPFLPTEVKQLKENNTLGSLVLGQMPDIKRVLTMAAAVKKDSKIRVNEIRLHTCTWVKGERVDDSADKPESERKSITCYKYNIA